MQFTERILKKPSYGFLKNESLYVPTKNEIFKEILKNANPLKKGNWITFLLLLRTVVLLSSLVPFFVFYFSWGSFLWIFLYALFVMATYTNFWSHRYCVHRAYSFRNSIVKWLCKNIVIKAVSEELHVPAHHVHHWAPDVPGDPYNPAGGFLYCFLADINHQRINQSLDEKDFYKVRKMLEHNGVLLNSYHGYKKWGTLSHPVGLLLEHIINWSLWFFLFYSIGGMSLVTASFGAAGLWSLSYRTLNYRVHLGGKEPSKERDSVGFSLNRTLPGILAGEWHNNHHLFPRSAKCGFEKNQLDMPWLFIHSLSRLGLVSDCRDDTNLYFSRKNRILSRRQG